MAKSNVQNVACLEPDGSWSKKGNVYFSYKQETITVYFPNGIKYRCRNYMVRVIKPNGDVCHEGTSDMIIVPIIGNWSKAKIPHSYFRDFKKNVHLRDFNILHFSIQFMFPLEMRFMNHITEHISKHLSSPVNLKILSEDVRINLYRGYIHMEIVGNRLNIKLNEQIIIDEIMTNESYKEIYLNFQKIVDNNLGGIKSEDVLRSFFTVFVNKCHSMPVYYLTDFIPLCISIIQEIYGCDDRSLSIIEPLVDFLSLDSILFNCMMLNYELIKIAMSYLITPKFKYSLKKKRKLDNNLFLERTLGKLPTYNDLHLVTTLTWVMKYWGATASAFAKISILSKINFRRSQLHLSNMVYDYVGKLSDAKICNIKRKALKLDYNRSDIISSMKIKLKYHNCDINTCPIDILYKIYKETYRVSNGAKQLISGGNYISPFNRVQYISTKIINELRSPYMNAVLQYNKDRNEKNTIIMNNDRLKQELKSNEERLILIDDSNGAIKTMLNEMKSICPDLQF